MRINVGKYFELLREKCYDIVIVRFLSLLAIWEVRGNQDFASIRNETRSIMHVLAAHFTEVPQSTKSSEPQIPPNIQITRDL